MREHGVKGWVYDKAYDVVGISGQVGSLRLREATSK